MQKRPSHIKFKAGDILLYLFFGILLAALLLTQYTLFQPSSGDTVRITCGTQSETYPLHENRTLTEHSLGVSLQIEIYDGGVRVTNADCPDQICVHTGTITKAGQSIVCLPAHCSVTIETATSAESGVDGIVG